METLDLKEDLIHDLYTSFGTLTDELLQNKGFTEESIETAVAKGILRKTYAGYYDIVDYDAFQAYTLRICSSMTKEPSIDIQIKLIYDLFVADIPLTNENLIWQGLSLSQIGRLVKLDVLKPKGTEQYELLWYDDLEQYANELEAQGEIAKANLCRYKNRNNSKKNNDILSDLNYIYEFIAAQEELNEHNLKGRGIRAYRLNRLINEGYLQRDSQNRITLCSSEGLYDYGKSLEELGQAGKACACYDACCRITFDERLLLYTVLCHLKRTDYKEALDLLKELRKSKISFYQTFSNYCVFLMSFSICLPSQECNIAQNLKLDDIVCFDSSFLSCSLDEVRELMRLIYNQKFKAALNYLKTTTSNNHNTFYDITSILLQKAIKRQKNVSSALTEAVRYRNITSVLQIINGESSLHQLKGDYKVYSFIANDINGIITARRMPKILDSLDTSLKALIFARRYNEAYKKCIKQAETKGISTLNSCLIMLLTWITELQKEYQSNDEVLVKTPKEDCKLYEEFYEILQSREESSAISFVKKHLNTPLHAHYSYLIIAFIHYDMLLQEENFMHSIGTFSKILRGTFEVKLKTYFMEIDELLENNRLIEATRLIEIVKKILLNGDSDEPDDYVREELMRLEVKIKCLASQVDEPVVAQSKPAI